MALLAAPALAQEPIDTAVNARIREAALQRSQVATTLHVLTDVHSPRLTGSPTYKAAADWAKEQLQAWGLEARLEPWDFGHPGWANQRVAVHAEAPWQGPILALPLAWTPGTRGTVRGQVVHLKLPVDPTQADLDAALAAVKGKLRGRIVLSGTDKPVPALNPSPMPPRHSDEALAKRFDPANPAQAFRPQAPRKAGVLEGKAVELQVDAFIKAEGALAHLSDSALRNGQVRAFANRAYDPAKVVPTLAVRHEDYGRITRLLADGRAVRLAVEVQNQNFMGKAKGWNVIADLPGTSGEVVILGAHLDAWHTATGATDNGVNAAVMMEVGRILAGLGVKPKRTIRIALWDAEEHGLLGSKAYVAAHYGSAEAPLPAFRELVAYFNADSGAGQIRGLSLFGPAEGAQVLRELLAPFQDLAVRGASSNASRPRPDRPGPSSDQASFTAAGLPAISVAQDGLEYFEYTWHTAIDTLERVPPEDPKRTAAVLASVAWHLAQREERLPFFTAETLPPVPPKP